MKERVSGVYMDHSAARILEPSSSELVSKIILSNFTHEEMQYALSKSENIMHNKERGEEKAYYQEIMEQLKGSNRILLFGPTHAKDELLNLLKEDVHFAGVQIEVKQTDKIQPDQQEVFVKEHFKIKN